MTVSRLILALPLLAGMALPAAAQQCGGEFSDWKAGVASEARANGVGAKGLATLQKARYSKKVIGRDRAQGVFAQSFAVFAGRMVSGYRLTQGKKHLKTYAKTFKRAEDTYGVPGPVITAFWALETDFGAVQGDFSTLDALATLAYDCRRPELFRPQLIAFLKLVDTGALPANVEGAWAGEVGQVQILPSDILEFGTDGDGNGTFDLRKSKPDVIMTTARFLQHLGWRAGEPWLQEVRITRPLPWEKTGRIQRLPVSQWADWGVEARDGNLATNLEASLLLPMGKDGPAFLAYPNYNVYLEWNQSFVYTLTASYLATRFAGAPKVDLRNPSPAFSIEAMKALQKKLEARGYDVGKIDGILGLKTREAIRAEQKRLSMPVDGWPTKALAGAI